MARWLRTLLGLTIAFGCAAQPVTPPPSTPEPAAPTAAPERSNPLADALTPIITREMEAKGIPGLSIAVVDDGKTVWAEGFGLARPGDKAPATASTVYRVGSVSKLFTDIAVMRLVERGELDLDAPVSDVLPEFKPERPGAKKVSAPVTLRQLMSHRAGIVREPPVGHYFDPTEPTIAATVASLNGTGIVYAPGSKTKYSNAGITVVGHVLEKKTGKPFAQVIDDELLKPMGMDDSGFVLTPALTKNLADASMWTREGRTFAAPRWAIGTLPAGNLYASMEDLARFMGVLLAGGEGTNGRVLEAKTLASMYEPQLTKKKKGFGLGFAVGELDGERAVRHGGAVYGFGTEFIVLPDARVGVAASASIDIANATVRRIAEHALALVLAARDGKDAPAFVHSGPLSAEQARALVGHYARKKDVIEISMRGGKPMLERKGTLGEVRAFGDGLAVDDLHVFREIEHSGDTLTVNDQKYKRIDPPAKKKMPRRWRGLVGEYGWDHNTLFILEHDGRLYALIEWHFNYPLTEVSKNVFAFPSFGMYHGEKLVFTRGRKGRATKVEAAKVVFERRLADVDSGKTFKIKRVRTQGLREDALAAKPPAESGDFLPADLVDVTTLAPTIKLDIRYASKNNFMDMKFYDQPRAFMQRPAAEALARINEALRAKGYGLLIHDAYRPWYVTKMFWDATPADKKLYVADPSKGSRHNRGCAVDLTLYDLKTGKPVEMVAGYDEMTRRSHASYPGGTDEQRARRNLLRRAMEAEGFAVYPPEWWHFDHGDWKRYRIGNLTFEELDRARDSSGK